MPSQKVLITGATSGIGYALVKYYSLKGFSVIACGRNEKKLQEMLDAGLAEQVLAFDITDQEAVNKASLDIVDIDLLILNAGDCLYIDDALHFDAKLFAEIININLVAIGYLLESFLTKMVKGGRVVLVSSSATIMPFPRAEAYGASKAGLDYLANSLRLDLIAHEIDVTLVHPGFVKTPLTDKNTFDMPFILTAEQAAQRIIQGVENGKNYLAFPKRLIWFLRIMKWLPNSVWQTMMLRSS